MAGAAGGVGGITVKPSLPIAGSCQDESSSLTFLRFLSWEKILLQVLHQSVSGLAATKHFSHNKMTKLLSPCLNTSSGTRNVETSLDALGPRVRIGSSEVTSLLSRVNLIL